MRKFLLYLVAFVAVAGQVACNSAKFPIDEQPAVKIDSRLLGKWMVKGKHKDNVTYTVARQSDYQYLITFKEKKNEPEQHTAFLSDINKVMFFNIHGKDDSGDSYVFFRVLDINAKADRVTVATLADSTMRYLKSAAEVRERITKNLENASFYEDTMKFYKVK